MNLLGEGFIERTNVDCRAGLTRVLSLIACYHLYAPSLEPSTEQSKAYCKSRFKLCRA